MRLRNRQALHRLQQARRPGANEPVDGRQPSLGAQVVNQARARAVQSDEDHEGLVPRATAPQRGHERRGRHDPAESSANQDAKLLHGPRPYTRARTPAKASHARAAGAALKQSAPRPGSRLSRPSSRHRGQAGAFHGQSAAPRPGSRHCAPGRGPLGRASRSRLRWASPCGRTTNAASRQACPPPPGGLGGAPRAYACGGQRRVTRPGGKRRERTPHGRQDARPGRMSRDVKRARAAHEPRSDARSRATETPHGSSAGLVPKRRRGVCRKRESLATQPPSFFDLLE